MWQKSFSQSKRTYQIERINIDSKRFIQSTKLSPRTINSLKKLFYSMIDFCDCVFVRSGYDLVLKSISDFKLKYREMLK